MLLGTALLSTLAISLFVQACFFTVAATFKTDTVTDLSYGLTFVILAGVVLLVPDPDRARFTLFAMVAAWGVRLAGYLLYRILYMKRDARFDGIREHFWRFFQFWFFQGIAVWVIMLPVTIWDRTPGPWREAKTIAVAIWAAGLIVETIADAQKFRYKRGGGDRWMSSGLWRYSRHPNYFGELLCWYGVFLFVAGDLAGWQWIAALGPMSITLLLLFATGIPPLEASALHKWGRDPAYQSYRRRTSILVPWRQGR